MYSGPSMPNSTYITRSSGVGRHNEKTDRQTHGQTAGHHVPIRHSSSYRINISKPSSRDLLTSDTV